VIVPSESIQEILFKRGVNTPMEAVSTGVDLERFFKRQWKSFSRTKSDSS